MLYKWAKNKKDEQEINNWWYNFRFKNGHKEITTDNFIDLNYTFVSYKIDSRYYRGYFTKDEVNKIFKVLDYNKGKIRSLAG